MFFTESNDSLQVNYGWETNMFQSIEFTCKVNLNAFVSFDRIRFFTVWTEATVNLYVTVLYFILFYGRLVWCDVGRVSL